MIYFHTYLLTDLDIKKDKSQQAIITFRSGAFEEKSVRSLNNAIIYPPN